VSGHSARAAGPKKADLIVAIGLYQAVLSAHGGAISGVGLRWGAGEAQSTFADLLLRLLLSLGLATFHSLQTGLAGDSMSAVTRQDRADQGDKNTITAPGAPLMPCPLDSVLSQSRSLPLGARISTAPSRSRLRFARGAATVRESPQPGGPPVGMKVTAGAIRMANTERILA